jgi:hypothetical protein
MTKTSYRGIEIKSAGLGWYAEDPFDSLGWRRFPSLEAAKKWIRDTGAQATEPMPLR